MRSGSPRVPGWPCGLPGDDPSRHQAAVGVRFRHFHLRATAGRASVSCQMGTEPVVRCCCDRGTHSARRLREDCARAWFCVAQFTLKTLCE